MEHAEEIRELIRGIAKESSSHIHVATVSSVDAGGETCVVDIDGSSWPDTRLTAVADGNTNLRFIPSVGSKVLVKDMSCGRRSDLMVVMFSSVSAIEIGTAEHTTAKADVLHEELDKMSARIDGIFDALENSATVTEDGGAAYKAAIVAKLQTLSDKEDFSGIENTNIKHG